MRCEDCLPLVEEYFDGEVTGWTAAAVGEHLSACADCAAALDALSFEQEIYARYDRGGLEVTPDLWARVSAEIAREARTPESPAAGRPFLSRARVYVAAALGALTARPALASSLALFVVAAGAGALWLSRRTQPNAQTHVAVNAPGSAPTVKPAEEVKDGGGTTPAVTAPSAGPVETNAIPAGSSHEAPREPGTPRDARRTRPGAGAEVDVEQLLAAAPAPKANTDIVVIESEEHNDDAATFFVNAAAPAGDIVATNARLLDPGEKDVARHVERAQMLLRSIKNVRASEASDADMAYEKTLSRTLLAENSTLQLEAEVKGDKETKQVLDQIQPFLLEIANMGDKPSREEVRSIRERVRKNEIVAALQVY